MRGARRHLAVGVLLVSLGGCGGTSVDAGQLLRDAKQSVDNAAALHFTLTSENVAGTGPLITGGNGDAKRPDGFAGTLTVVDSGFNLSVVVVSVGGAFYASTPLSNGVFVKTDPSKYGFGDPGRLLDPANGLSSLLTVCTGAALKGDDRLNGELLHELSCSMPGDRVGSLLTSADPSKPVAATVGVNSDSHQLRRVALVGPFFSKDKPSTFTLVLDRYGEKVSVTPPPGS